MSRPDTHAWFGATSLKPMHRWHVLRVCVCVCECMLNRSDLYAIYMRTTRQVKDAKEKINAELEPPPT